MYYEPVQMRLMFVLERYGKQPLSDFLLSHSSCANEVFSFDAQDGRFFLKNCLKNNSAELLGLETDFGVHLRAQGVGCPEVVTTPDGAGMVEYNGLLFQLTRAFPGESAKWSDTLQPWHASETFTALGALHKAAASFDACRDSPRIKSYQLDKIERWLQQLAETLQQAPQRAVAQQMLELIPCYLNELTALRAPVAAMLEDAQIQMIHGDFHCYNAFFADQRYVGCCDFDFIRRDLRLFDICWCWRSLFNYFYLVDAYGVDVDDADFNPPESELQAINDQMLSDAIAGYRQHNELPDQELRHLPTMMKLMPLTEVQFFDLSNSDEECRQHLAWFNHSLERVPRVAERWRRSLERLLP